jgi:DNA-binding NarL/FixJ family response regulator
MVSKVSVLIVISPGLLQESLNSFLGMLDHLEIMGNVSTDTLALAAITGRCPNLLIIDTHNKNGDALSLVGQVKARWPGIRCLVLTESVKQKDAAKISGADEALVWGFSTSQFLAVINQLSQEELME